VEAKNEPSRRQPWRSRRASRRGLGHSIPRWRWLDLLLNYYAPILEILDIPEKRRISKFRGISMRMEFQLYYDI
jgi:hypothetical protein